MTQLRRSRRPRRTTRPADGQGFLFDPGAEILFGDIPAPPQAAAFTPSPAAAEAVQETLDGLGGITTQDQLSPSGWRARFEANLAAITTWQALEAEGRPATPDEQAVLRRWAGWGALAEVFERREKQRLKYAPDLARLSALLDERQLDAARLTTLNAHYTDLAIVQAMWKLTADLGFGGGQVLEPGCGSGNFIGAAPAGASMTGVELDTVTAGICQALHPCAQVIQAGFEDVHLPEESFDLVIGNVPFGKIIPPDPVYNRDRFSLHNFVLWKALNLLRPGGLLVAVTSSFTMDAPRNRAARAAMASLADLAGAIRLPATAHQRAAGTRVVTDILVLRRRLPGALPAGAGWLDEQPVTLDGNNLTIGRYFTDHPDMVLGRLRGKGGAYGRTALTVEPTGDLPAQLAAACGRVASAAAGADLGWVSPAAPLTTPVAALESDEEGTISPAAGGGFTQVVSGIIEPLDVPASQAREVTAFIGLRDTARMILATEEATADDSPGLGMLRRQLSACYDEYLRIYGPVGRFGTRRTGNIDPETGEPLYAKVRPPVMRILRSDPYYPLFLALEEFDAETQTAIPAAIQTRRTLGPARLPDRADTPEDAVALSMDLRGHVDLGYIAGLLGLDQGEARRVLNREVFDDPESGDLLPAAEYLSGNVRAKLGAAEKAADEDLGYRANVEALRAVQPVDLTPAEITARMGASWIPASVIQEFLQHILNDHRLRVEHGGGQYWKVTGDRDTVHAVATWGTFAYPGPRLAQSILEQQPIEVKDKIDMPDGGERYVLNPEATLAAVAKADEMRARFSEWTWENPARARGMAARYNEIFNSLRLRSYEGTRLHFPGMSLAFTPHDHQHEGAAQIICETATLLAHDVGGGKSATMAGGAMKLRQLGLSSKPCIVVPNHLLEQFAAEFLHVYPRARVLIAYKSDLKGEKRRRFTARCATGDWDCVIIAQSSFSRIKLTPAHQEEYLALEAARLQSWIEANGSSQTVKRMQLALKRTRDKIKEKVAAARKDKGVTFEEMGVTRVFYDECFPYETEVITDRGPLPIGEIVEQGLRVNVASVNLDTGATEWKPVHRWVKKSATGLVRITHEHGEFVCTPNHPVWVEGEGYRHAGELEGGETLRLVSETVHPEVGGTEILPHQMLSEGVGCSDQAGTDMRMVRGGVRAAQWPEAAILQESMRGQLAKRAKGSDGKPGADAQELSGNAAWEAESGGQRTPQAIESHAGSGDPSEGICFPAGTFVAVRPWWERDRNGSSADSGEPSRPADGVQYSDPLSGAFVRVAAALIRRGFGGCAEQDGDRGGRKLTQNAPVAVPGSPEDGGLGSSRVVGVEVLESGSLAGSGEGSGGNYFVYNLEVADNHNYFANRVLVSNCHEAKNLRTPSRISDAAIEGSQRATDLDMKIWWLREKYGCGPVLATATPVANSITEVYVMQHYLRPDLLLAAGIEVFDTWAATFAECVTRIELAPEGGGSFRPRTRLSRIKNLPELLRMLHVAADIRSREDLNLTVPLLAELEDGRRTTRTVVCPASPGQEAYTQELGERAEKIRSRTVEPDENGIIDNMLRISTHGRMCGLDGRMVGAAQEIPGKIAYAARETHRIWLAHKDDVFPAAGGEGEHPVRGACQFTFCDLGTPTGRSWNAYQEYKDECVALGMPADGIRFIHEAGDDQAKAALFWACRNGAVSVLVGSTTKMGTGMNAQLRAVALHHLDAPWRPADVAQRDGRIIRQGNHYTEVEVIRYVTEGSFDAYMWQTLEYKAQFIAQLMRRTFDVREVDDIGDIALSYNEVKALTTGNMLLLDKAEADAALVGLERAFRTHHRTQALLADNIDRASRDLPGLRERAARYAGAIARRTETRGEAFRMTADGGGYAKREDAGNAIHDLIAGEAKYVGPGDRRVIRVGTLGGHDFTCYITNPNGWTWIAIYMDGIPKAAEWSLQNFKATGHGQYLTARLEHLLASLETGLADTERDIEKAEANTAEARRQLGAPFPKEQELAAARTRVAEINAQLASLAAEKKPEAEPGSGAGRDALRERRRPRMPQVIAPHVLEILQEAVTDGYSLRIPRDLDRDVHLEVNRVLESAGGVWDKRRRVHVFDEPAGPLIGQILDDATTAAAA